MGKRRIKRHLGRQYRWFLIVSLVGFPGVMMLAKAAIDSRLAFFEWVTGLLVVVYALGLVAAVWRLKNLDRHPDLVRLSRYAAHSELLPAMEAELAGNQMARIGRMHSPFRSELGQAEVWITPSWLIYVTTDGYRMQFFRVDRLVVAARLGKSVVLADDLDVLLVIRGTEGGLTRVLAEILTRVPWVLSRFDSETEKTWTESQQLIIAKVEQRREQIKASRPEAVANQATQERPPN